MRKIQQLLIDGVPHWQMGDVVVPMLAGGKGDIPEPSAEERQLTATNNKLAQQQYDLTVEQKKEQDAFAPILMKEYGLIRNVDPTTGAVSYTEDPNDTLRAQGKEIQTLANERSLKALKGELPVSPTLDNELNVGEAQLKERLSRQLGPGYETSTPGIQAMSEYKRMSTALREAERRDQLTTAEALSLNRQNGRLQYNSGVTDSTITQPAMTRAQLLTGAQAGQNSAMNYYTNQRNERMGYQQMAAQERAGYASAAMGAVGMAGAAGIMKSDPALKKDIEPVSDARLLTAIRRMPVSRWKYKADHDQKEYIGAMAPDMPKDVSPTGKDFHVISYLGMLTGSIRALDKKLDKMERISKGRALSYA